MAASIKPYEKTWLGRDGLGEGVQSRMPGSCVDHIASRPPKEVFRLHHGQFAAPHHCLILYSPATMQQPDILSPAWCSPASVRSMLQSMWQTGPCAAAGQSLTVSILPPGMTLECSPGGNAWSLCTIWAELDGRPTACMGLP